MRKCGEYGGLVVRKHLDILLLWFAWKANTFFFSSSRFLVLQTYLSSQIHYVTFERQERDSCHPTAVSVSTVQYLGCSVSCFNVATLFIKTSQK